MENKTLIFKLSKVIEYSKEGDFHKTATIELSAPGMPVYDLSVELSQQVMRALLDAREFKDNFSGETSSTDMDQLDANAMKVILMASKNTKFSDISKICHSLFLQVGTYDGKTPLKETVYNMISVNDYTMMVCEYCANFIFPSLFPEGG